MIILLLFKCRAETETSCL